MKTKETVEEVGTEFEVVIESAPNKVLAVNPDMAVLRIDADWLTCECEKILHRHGALKMPEEGCWWMSLPQSDKEDITEALRMLGIGVHDIHAVDAQVKASSDVAAKLDAIWRRTLDYYIEKGYLDRVYGGGKKAIGISRDSFIRFTTRRMLKKEGLA